MDPHCRSINKRHVGSIEEMIEYVVQSAELSLRTNPLKGALMMIPNYLKRDQAVLRLIRDFAPKDIVFLSARKDLKDYLSYLVKGNTDLQYSVIDFDLLSSINSPFILAVQYWDFLKSDL